MITPNISGFNLKTDTADKPAGAVSNKPNGGLPATTVESNSGVTGSAVNKIIKDTGLGAKENLGVSGSTAALEQPSGIEKLESLLETRADRNKSLKDIIKANADAVKARTPQ